MGQHVLPRLYGCRRLCLCHFADIEPAGWQRCFRHKILRALSEMWTDAVSVYKETADLSLHNPHTFDLHLESITSVAVRVLTFR